MKFLDLEYIELRADGREVAFSHIVCPKEDAPTILFVHGFPLDHSMWLGQLPLATDASLLMVDLCGYGQSPTYHKDMTMRIFADDLAELLEHLGIPKVIFCGLSMGGYIGWEFAAAYPDLLDGMICCNTRATADTETVARGRRVAAAQVSKTGAKPVADAMKEKLFSPTTLSRDPELVEQICAGIRATDSETIALGQLAMAIRRDHWQRLGEISCKVLVVAGSDDQITAADEMLKMSLMLNHGTFVEIAEAGHLSPAEQPEAFNRAFQHWFGSSQTG